MAWHRCEHSGGCSNDLRSQTLHHRHSKQRAFHLCESSCEHSNPPFFWNIFHRCYIWSSSLHREKRGDPSSFLCFWRSSCKHCKYLVSGSYDSRAFLGTCTSLNTPGTSMPPSMFPSPHAWWKVHHKNVEQNNNEPVQASPSFEHGWADFTLEHNSKDRLSVRRTYNEPNLWTSLYSETEEDQLRRILPNWMAEFTCQ